MLTEGGGCMRHALLGKAQANRIGQRPRHFGDRGFHHGTARDGLLPLPGQGPVLTWRAVTETAAPPIGAWDLSLGDIELF